MSDESRNTTTRLPGEGKVGGRVKFTPKQLALLESVFPAKDVTPTRTHEEIMYEAGIQTVLKFVRNNLSSDPHARI